LGGLFNDVLISSGCGVDDDDERCIERKEGSDSVKIDVPSRNLPEVTEENLEKPL
jgi:hypothetical protein